MLTGGLKITDDKIFYEAIRQESYKKLQNNIPKISSKIKPDVSNIISRELNNSPTVNELLAGKLKDDFGLFGNVAKVTITNIINHLSENIKLIIVRSATAGSVLTISVELLSGDITKLISVPGASFPVRGGTGSVDWLEWLLTRGTQVVIGDYWLYPNAKGRTRSGGNKVMKKIEGKSRDPFRVDPNYAGTIDDNFITRALESVADDILNVVASEIERTI